MRFISSLLALFTIFSTLLFAGPNRWTSSGPEAASVLQVVADPADADTAYVRTPAGIYKTTDGGQSWRPVNNGLPDVSVAVFLVAEDIPPLLYAAISNTVLASMDGGEHWLRRGKLGSLAITNLAYDPPSRTLLAGTSGGIYISSDRGETWMRSSIPDRVGGIDRLSVSATTGYAVSYAHYPAGVTTMLRSTDGGRSWQQILKAPDLLYANPSSGAVYGTTGQSLFVSHDDAKTWTKLPWPGPGSMTALVPVGGDLYAATSAGVFAYSERKQYWARIGSAISVHSFAVVSSSPRRLYAAPPSGMLTLIEGDDDWTPVTWGLPGAVALDVALSPTQPSVAYTTASTGVFRTDDAGQTWNRVKGVANSPHVAVSPTTPDTAYLSTYNAVFKTTDGGANWKGVTPSIASQLAVAPSDGTTLYATLANGMAKSIDAGETWSSIMSGLSFDYYDFYYGFQATSMAVDPSNSSTVYLARSSGLFKTTDGGASWQQATKESSIRALAMNPSDPSTIYAARESSGLLKSADQGSTWTSAGLIDKHVHALAMSGGRIYAGSDDGRVYSSDDGGRQWNGFNAGLSRGAVSRIVVDASGNYLLAATAGGVYEYDVADQDIGLEPLLDDALRLPGEEKTGFVLPVVGRATGVGGTSFSSDLDLTNQRDVAQPIIVTWIPEAGTEGPKSFRLTLPNGGMSISDFALRFGIDGIGSLAFLPIDDAGNADSNAAIDGSARIWTHLPDGRAPREQSVAAARGSSLLEHSHAVVTQLRHDADFRTNAGIVNLSTEAHQFTIQINGERASRQVTVSVPPLSLVQIAIPDADYGTLSLDVFADISTQWLFYGSVIDRATDEAQTFTR